MMTEITIKQTDDMYSKQPVQRIWLVRHGETLWNVQQRFCGHTDIPLSPTGTRQARWLASQLQHMPITTIYTSDLSRTQKTAAILVKKRPAQIIPSPAWREIAFGAWEGFTYTEIAADFKGQLNFFTNPEHYAPPDGESLSDVLRRVMPALTAIMHDKPITNRGDIVIVSHGGTLRALLCSLLGMPLSRQWQLRLDPGSLSAIDLSLDKNGSLLASLLLLNEQHIPRTQRTPISRAVSTEKMRLLEQEMEQKPNV